MLRPQKNWIERDIEQFKCYNMVPFNVEILKSPTVKTPDNIFFCMKLNIINLNYTQKITH